MKNVYFIALIKNIVAKIDHFVNIVTILLL